MSQHRVCALVVVWSGCVIAGLAAMLGYETTPARTSVVASHWPDGTALVPDPALPTLVMFVHPHCPCTTASLAELERLAAQCPGQLAVRLVFLRPDGFPDGWERTGLYAAAQRIPQSAILCDPGGAEAARFGAAVSGQTLLYAADGRLMFQGGITGSRGHQGDNAGRDALAALVQRGRAPRHETPVYGCNLMSSDGLGEESAVLCRP